MTKFNYQLPEDTEGCLTITLSLSSLVQETQFLQPQSDHLFATSRGTFSILSGKRKFLRKVAIPIFLVISGSFLANRRKPACRKMFLLR